MIEHTQENKTEGNTEKQNFYFAPGTCPSGAGALTGLFRSMAGVTDVTVHYDDGAIEVAYDRGANSAENIIASAESEMGLHLSTESPNKPGEGKAETC